MGKTEQEVRAFAERFPTPNVLRAVCLAEEGRVTWEQLYNLACEATIVAMEGAFR